MLRGMIIIFVFLCLWQASTSYFSIPNYLLPSPYQVTLSFSKHPSLLLQHSFPTMLELAGGFIFGILSGCLAGAIIALYRPAHTWLLPVLIVSQAIPTFAIAPLIIVWLGYGLSSKIIISVLMIFFPVASAFYDGLRKTPIHWLEISKTMNASKLKTFWKIQLPAALPDLAAGIRIAAVIAPIGAIIGEWIGSSQGLGYLMITANARLEIDLMLAALLIIILFALTLYYCMDRLLQYVIWWKI